jgi:hypothetical protein
VARIEREAGALGEVPRELEMDPRVVERKAGRSRDQPLAGGEEHEREQRRRGYERIVNPLTSIGHARR